MVVGVLEPVPQVVEPGALLAVPDLQVGESRRAARAPVDYPLAAVDEPFAVQINERRAHRLAGALVQGEAPARPVARRPQALDLLVDPIAVLVDPLPDQIDERLSAQVVPRLVVRGELPLHNHLGGDAGVVGAGQVEGRVADHPVPADHQVLQRHGQRVPHVELARHVRGRHDDDVGLLRAVDDGREVTAAPPRSRRRAAPRTWGRTPLSCPRSMRSAPLAVLRCAAFSRVCQQAFYGQLRNSSTKMLPSDTVVPAQAGTQGVGFPDTKRRISANCLSRRRGYVKVSAGGSPERGGDGFPSPRERRVAARSAL